MKKVFSCPGSKANPDQKSSSEGDDERKTRSSRLALLEAAKEAFATLGFDGAKVREIAEKAGVNGSQINYYFQDKAHLYRAILDRSTDEKDIAHLIGFLQNPTSETEVCLRLEMFATELLTLFARDEFAIRLIMLELIRGLPLGKDLIEERVGRLWSALMTFVEQAKNNGVIRSDVDPRIVALTILGVFHALACARGLTQKFADLSLENEEDRSLLAKKLIGALMAGLRNGGSGGQNEKPA